MREARKKNREADVTSYVQSDLLPLLCSTLSILMIADMMFVKRHKLHRLFPRLVVLMRRRAKYALLRDVMIHEMS